MALFFPFDSDLKGHVEQVEVDISSLEYPIFVFPKGSFFVSELYGIIKGTNRIVRPGLDYKVLSLNDQIKFNDGNATLDKTLRDNYVRNAVLWRGDADVGIIQWHVPYCGGEETTKVGEYDNYLNSLYNLARTSGTTNLFTTPYQAWGGYADAKNEQIVSGANIYHKYFDFYEDMNQRGGLGWGKIQLAIMALADVITSGGDPMEIQAYYDWIRHNEEEFIIHKEALFADLHQQINNLDAKRVGIDQFVHSNQQYNHYNKQFFLEHNNVILRGLDPDEQGFTLDPISTKRNDVGFYGLAGWGSDIDLRATHVSQRKATLAQTNRFKTKFLTLGATNVNDPRRIYWSVGCANKNYAEPGKDYWMYIVSKRLGIVIQQASVNALAYNAGTNTLSGNFPYPNQYTDYADDILFGYILDRTTMQGDFNEVKRYRYLSYHRKYGYGLSVNTRGLVLSSGEIISKNPTLDNDQDSEVGTGNVEVVVTRKFGDYPETNYLGISKIIDTQATVLKTINWVAGETRKVLNLTMTNSMFTQNETIRIQLLRYTGSYLIVNNELASVVVGYRNTNNINNAYIKVVPSEDSSIQEVIVDERVRHFLVVQYTRNVDYHRINPSLKVTQYQMGSNAAGVVVNKGILGEPIFIEQGLVVYPLQFTGFNNAEITPITVELVDQSSTFSTNRVNLFINNDLPSSIGAQTFTSLSPVSEVVGDGVEVIFRHRTNTVGVFPNGTSLFKLDFDQSGIVVLSPPVCFNDVIEYKLLLPVSLVGKTLKTTISYRLATGYVALMTTSGYAYPVASAETLRLYGKSGAEISYPILNEPFRLMYRPPNGGQDYVNVELDSTMADRSMNVKFGGDAVLNPNGSYTITKPNVMTPSWQLVQVSVDGWITVSEIDKSVSVDDRDYGVFYLKIVPMNTPTTYKKITVPLNLIDVKFFDVAGYDLGDEIKINTSFIMTLTSKEIDLTQTTSVNISGVSGLSVANFIIDATTNTVIATVNVSSAALGNDKTINVQLNAAVNHTSIYRKRFSFVN